MAQVFAIMVYYVGGVLLFSFPFAFLVMLLWNWVMVDVFALQALTFWQAWGLYMLCVLLFKSITVDNSNAL